MTQLQPVDLRIADRLKARDFRREWFRAELEFSVPDQYRLLRERRGITPADLASATEEDGLQPMKQSSISRFENSSTAKWSIETLLRLADALDARLTLTLTPAEEVIAFYEAAEFRQLPGLTIMRLSSETSETQAPFPVQRIIGVPHEQTPEFIPSQSNSTSVRAAGPAFGARQAA